MSIKDESGGRGHAPGPHQTVESHNAWVEDQRFRWCRPCWESTGKKRVLGWTPNWGYSEADRAAWEQKSGVLTCPLCRTTVTVTTPGTVWDDAPDDFADRVAP